MKKSISHTAYDQLADAYATQIDTKPHNAYYDRPAVQSLLSNLAGKTVLDAGCGTGVYTEWLIQQGAAVVGMDASEKMLDHAQARNAGQAEFHLANLEEPLTMLHDGQFDGVVSPLTISYIADLNQPFAEFNRVLKPGGWLVFSTEHPFNAYHYFNIKNYYATQPVSCVWTGFGGAVEMKNYYRSLSAITEALAMNGFWIERIIEPLPRDDFKAADEETYRELCEFPGFIFFRAIKKQAV